RPPQRASPSRAPSESPGTRYLLDRLDAQRHAREAPEIAPLRAALGPLLRHERVERYDRGPLLASAYHLVPRGRASDYRAAVREAKEALGPGAVRPSGPWPPYAFAPEVLR